MDERNTRGNRGERLHKVLARAGVASRRDCEKLIAQGRVKVDGKTVTQMGLMVDTAEQVIAFDGETIRAEKPAYFVVYKPKGVVCTTHDQFDRTSVVDLVRDRHARRSFPVGRMESASSRPSKNAGPVGASSVLDGKPRAALRARVPSRAYQSLSSASARSASV